MALYNIIFYITKSVFKGYLIMPVFSQKRSEVPGSHIVVNPVMGASEILLSFAQLPGGWSG